MKNEKGLSLIELLAAITIFFIVMGVAYSLFASIRLYTNRSEETYYEKSNILLTESILNDYLNAPIELTYLPDNAELKFKTFNHENYSILLDSSHNILSLYQSGSNDLDMFTYDTCISSIHDIAKMELKGEDQQEISGNLPVNQIYSLYITYKIKRTTITGAKTVSEKKVEYIIKPFQLIKEG